MLKGWSRQEWSWAFYDWANSVYALVVMTAFFPLFLSSQVDSTGGNLSSTALLGYASSAASALVVLLAPLLGAVADQFGARKKFLAAFAVLGVCSTGGLALLSEGQALAAVFLFVAGNVGFAAANGFYDALLLSVTSAQKYDRLSALGFSLGYAGSLVLFGAAVLVFQNPGLLGFSAGSSVLPVIFVAVAAWWLLFTLPLLAWVKEETALRTAGAGLLATLGNALGELKDTVREVREHRQVGYFLLAYWLYIDGVHTVIKMAMAYSTDLGFKPEISLTAILLTNIIAVPATLLYAGFAARIGVKRSIMAGVGAYLLVTAGAPLMSEHWHFFILAGVVGLVQGGVQAMSRSMFARLIPANESGKYYGLYNMVGKFAAVIGPGLMASTALLLGDRLSILAIPVLLIAGMWLLTRVDEPAPA